MKVLRKGKKIKVAFHLECKRCTALVECQLSELTRNFDPRDGAAYVLNCPECKGETWFSEFALVNLRTEETP